LIDPSSEHAAIQHRYQVIYDFNDLFAGALFTVGSVLFFWDSTHTIGTWLFLIGSILFVVRPSISYLREQALMRQTKKQTTQEPRSEPSRDQHPVEA
jgi:hypothetical protein